jgi:hypothetical protein
MSINGKWLATVQVPTGAVPMLISFNDEGDGILTGSVSAQGKSTAISDGKWDGSQCSWVAALTMPMPMKMEFSALLNGDSLEGNIKAGMFGSFSFNAERHE